ncbi:MAG TPA: septation protein SepH [Jatrophihabitans sp.]|nr:septation protein SepH [Jatrophihabitans sp.]
MRQLRLVHLTDDGTTLLLESPDAHEQFHLPVDAVLRHAVRAERPRPTPSVDAATPAEPGATLGPREIQVRVRAGESPESLADAYGMPLDRVLRFATAVVEERRRITDEARRARARRTTTDGQVVVFGEAVDDRFAAHGIPPTDVTWDALRPDGEWLVVARWIDDEEHTAEWVFHRTSRTVTPVDDAAIDLLSDRPIRPVPPPEPEPPAPPPFAPGVFVFPPMPDAVTGPVPRIDDVFDQDAPPEGPLEAPPLVAPRAATHEPTPEPAPLPEPEPTPQPAPDPPTETTAGLDEPPLPLGIGTWTAGAEAATEKLRRAKTSRRRGDEDRGTRTRVPAWDDILLGVRRSSD